MSFGNNIHRQINQVKVKQYRDELALLLLDKLIGDVT